MGQIADDMIEGICCSLCGQYFQKGGSIYTHGIPVVCYDCWDELTKAEKKNYEKARVSTF